MPNGYFFKTYIVCIHLIKPLRNKIRYYNQRAKKDMQKLKNTSILCLRRHFNINDIIFITE